MPARTGKKTIGLDVPAPAGTCTGAKCPWHGLLPVRGRIFTGVVRSAKAADTAVVEWNYYHYLHKYERYERRKTRVSVHNPRCIDARTGDMVIIAECRPLSKAKRFVVVGKVAQKKVRS